MYFWRINELKRQLVERPLTDREIMPYLLVSLVPFAFWPLDKNVELWDHVGHGAASLMSATYQLTHSSEEYS